MSEVASEAAMGSGGAVPVSECRNCNSELGPVVLPLASSVVSTRGRQFGSSVRRQPTRAGHRDARGAAWSTVYRTA